MFHKGFFHEHGFRIMFGVMWSGVACSFTFVGSVTICGQVDIRGIKMPALPFII